MNPLQGVRIIKVVDGTQVTNATTANSIDTWDANGQPFDHALLYLDHNAAAATNSSAQWTSLRILHGADTNVTSGTAVSGLTGTTNTTASSTQFRLPEHNDTSNAAAIIASVSLGEKERYLFVESQSASSYNTHVFVCILSRGKDTPAVANQVGNDTIATSTALGPGVTTFVQG